MDPARGRDPAATDQRPAHSYGDAHTMRRSLSISTTFSASATLCALACAALMLAACGDDSTGASDGGAASETTKPDSSTTGGTTDLGVTTGTDQGTTGGGEDVKVDLCQDDEDCDDGLWCNGVESCSPDALEAGSDGCIGGDPEKGTDPNPVDCVVLGPCDEESDSFPEVVLTVGDACDDGIACTVSDVCQDDGGCKGAPDDVRCDDALFCNGLESCNTVIGCLPGDPPKGTDSDPTDCLVPGPCEEATQDFTLVPAEVGKACDDTVPCTFEDACTGAGTCEGQPSHSFCSDDVFCNGDELCDPSVGDCVAGALPEPPADEDPDDCMVPGACDEASTSFPAVPAAEAASCDDGIACTTDACDDAGACIGTAEHTECDDGDFCNGPELCDTTAGCQVGVPPSPPADPNPLDCMVVSQTCDSMLGAYPVVPASAGAACDDGVECTGTDQCDGGGACSGTPADAACDDQNACNGTETCVGATGCQVGTPLEQPADDDPDDCMVPAAECNPLTGAFDLVAAGPGSDCDDGVTCTTEDQCNDQGQCSGAPQDSMCVDTDLCDGAETCDATLGCQQGTAPQPVDADPTDCMVPAAECNPLTGAFDMVAAGVGDGCDDGVACTTVDVCNDAGSCGGTPDDSACGGTFCTGAETCDGADGCLAGTPPTPPTDPDLTDCVAPTQCDDATQGFLDEPLQDGTPCTGGNPQWVNGMCATGVCQCTPVPCTPTNCGQPDGCGGTCFDPDCFT